MGAQPPPGSCMVRIFQNVSQRWSLKKEFRMHCNALVMLYLKDSPLEGVQNVLVCLMLYQKDGPLRSSDNFFAKCML